MEATKTYQPINCSLYDYLEAWAVKQTDCDVLYLNEQNEEARFTKKIKDLRVKNKVEYVEWNDGSTMRLDQLIEINEVRFWGMTC
ncbi:MAG TPA: hypothetical protein DCS93_34345 [Microscillaceae bacterium]|nr:hypothetical protein [Microscillaceae bacterium]